MIHYSCNEYSIVIEYFDKVIANPQIWELFKSSLENNRSLSKELGRYEKSLGYYKKILEFGPTNIEVLYRVRIVMLLSNDILTGIGFLRSDVRIKPNLVNDAILNDPDIKLLKNWNNLQKIF